MIADVVAELSEIGLGIGPEKTHWTSSPPLPEEMLMVMAKKVQWEENLIFVGTVVDLRGTSGPAIHYRKVQANKAFGKWQSLLQCGWIPKQRRMKMLPKTVWAAFLWSSSTWTATKDHFRSIASWSARTAARVLRLRRAPWQQEDQWWRFLHKMGHRAIAKHEVDLVAQCKRRVHTWAGHVARQPPSSPAGSALRCRGMQWWRWRQAEHVVSGDKWSGPHPRRFKIRRWEEQLSEAFGEGFGADVRQNTGWLSMAHDREAWKQRFP